MVHLAGPCRGYVIGLGPATLAAIIAGRKPPNLLRWPMQQYLAPSL